MYSSGCQSLTRRLAGPEVLWALSVFSFELIGQRFPFQRSLFGLALTLSGRGLLFGLVPVVQCLSVFKY
jgi:hypothetical protein